MKPNIKVGSFLLAIVMMFSVFAIAGCTPTTINKEWSYKTSDNELAIGVYIYSLNAAYSQAESFAKKLDDYDSTSDKWLDEKIKDDDGNEQVAREWIKDQAKKMCLSYLVVDEQLKKENVNIGQATIDSATSQAESYWNVGPYASQGYVMPMKKQYEKYGVSLDSFAYCTTLYNTKYEALFKAVYGKGGSKEVSDADLTKYFKENYTDYSYLPVNLYTSTKDEAGSSKNVAMSDKEIKKVEDQLNGYKNDLNKGGSFDDVIASYKKSSGSGTDSSVSKVEVLDKSSIGDELKEAIGKLKTGKAETLKVGSGDSAIYYLVYKKDVSKDVDSYIGNESNRAGVLASMKSDEFSKYIDSLAEKLKYEENTSVIDKYKPELFFVAVEPTTSASTTSASDKSSK